MLTREALAGCSVVSSAGVKWICFTSLVQCSACACARMFLRACVCRLFKEGEARAEKEALAGGAGQQMVNS